MIKLLVASFLIITPMVQAQGHPEIPAPAPALDEEVGTWSIIARDPDTGQIGIAVQSRAFRAGRTVPYAEPGVGLVATQAASANTNHGRKAMEWLREGISPQEIVDRLVAEDPDPSRRQVTVIDNQGRIAVWTGPEASYWAGHRIGDQFSAQGNILAGPEVVDETFRHFQESRGEGDFADRLLDALAAGQAVGGDARGMQAGAVLVIEAEPDPEGSERYRGVDIRVDDHRDPFGELRRLLDIVHARRAAQASNRLAAEGRLAESIEAMERATRLEPTHDQHFFNLALRYAEAGRRQEAIEALGHAIESHPRYVGLAAENPGFDGIRDDPEFQRLMAGGSGG